MSQHNGDYEVPTEPTGHVLLDAAVQLYGDLTSSIGALARCGHHDPHAERTLMALAHQHRPYIDSEALAAAREGRLFPGWDALCPSCNRRYPCDTVRQMCHTLGVFVPGVLV